MCTRVDLLRKSLGPGLEPVSKLDGVASLAGRTPAWCEGAGVGTPAGEARVPCSGRGGYPGPRQRKKQRMAEEEAENESRWPLSASGSYRLKFISNWQKSDGQCPAFLCHLRC